MSGFVFGSRQLQSRVAGRLGYGRPYRTRLHLLVVPHHHFPDITALTTAEGAAMFEATQRAVRALQEALAILATDAGLSAAQ